MEEVIFRGGDATMNMKEHILAAMREQIENWEALLSTLNEEQILAPNFDLDWSIKDVLAHLLAWQQFLSPEWKVGFTIESLNIQNGSWTPLKAGKKMPIGSMR